MQDLFSNFFKNDAPKPAKRTKRGGQNPIVFHDYESYVAKFQNKEKTTHTRPVTCTRETIRQVFSETC